MQNGGDVTEKAATEKPVSSLEQQPGDLPPLNPDRSPESATWVNSVAVCACMLKENVTDVREWLLYHRCEHV